MKSFWSSASQRNMQPPNLEFLRFEFEDLVFLFFLYQIGLIGRFKSHTKSFALKYYRYGYIMRNSDGICKHISVNIKNDILTDIWKWNIDRYMIFFQKWYFDRYMPKFFIFWAIYENFYFWDLSIYRSKYRIK